MPDLEPSVYVDIAGAPGALPAIYIGKASGKRGTVLRTRYIIIDTS